MNSFKLLAACCSLVSIVPLMEYEAVLAQTENAPLHLQDRGPGIPTSMFGTYVREKELLLYPFFEYYFDANIEYKPAELGYGLEEDFRGRYRAAEGIMFVSYGFTDWLAAEVEVAAISASLKTSNEDSSGIPHRIRESGLGDVEGQLRLRWFVETETHPEVFSYLEAVAPLQKKKLLIGTPDWEFKFGTGLIRGLDWGTITLKISVEYIAGESKLDLGEYAVEYLKRISPAWRFYAGVEGKQDEVEFIAEAQWQWTESVFVKFNNAFGITSKSTDWAPEIGIMFSFPLAQKLVQ